MRDPLLYSREQAAQLLNISIPTLDRWVTTPVTLRYVYDVAGVGHTNHR